MPYLRPGSRRWQIRRRHLVGVGDTGVLATGTTDRRLAERMEHVLEAVAERAVVEPSYRAVLDALLERRLTLADVVAADARGDMGALRAALVDPPLAEAIARLRRSHRDRGRGLDIGLDLLARLAPPRARLSHVRDPRAVMALCLRAEDEGRKRNTVRRTLLRAVSLLLRAEVGAAERDRIFADVRYAGEDDTREVELSPADVQRLMDACAGEHARAPGAGYDALGVGLRLALALSMDRGTLFGGERAGGEATGLRVRHLRIDAEPGDDGEDVYEGTVYVDDHKTRTRARTLPLSDSLCRALLPFAAGKAPDDLVLPLAYSQVSARFDRVREIAGLPGLRFKDLRAQFAIAAERAGLMLTVTAGAMGHGDEATTRRYQRRRVALSPGDARAVEVALGFAA